MENFSHGDDDDNASFASFLEHETAQPFHEEKKIVSSAPATPKSTPQYPNQDAGETKEKSMHALTNGKTKRTFSVQDYKNITKSPPREIKELLKTSGTKRAVCLHHFLVHVVFGAKIVYTYKTPRFSTESQGLTKDQEEDKGSQGH